MTLAHKDKQWFLSSRRAVLIVDLVESVRLIEEDEAGTVGRWLAFVEHAESQLREFGTGRKVKSTGDGMLLDLDSVPEALRLAFALMQSIRERNAALPENRQLHLRMGIETGDLIVDRHDVYGHQVNVAARLAGLAAPGQIVASAAVRDQIVEGVDADIEDLGECFLKHIRRPVRAYRVAPVGEGVAQFRFPAAARALLPTLAVIPFRFAGAQGAGAVGQILAEELIRSFGQSPHLTVISRLSTAPFSRGDRTVEEIGDLLDASHIVTGSVVTDGGMLKLSLDLTEVRSRQVIWSGRFSEKAAQILLGDQEMISRIVEEVGKTILNRELHRARTLPVRTLESYTLMLAAINAMYRLSRSDFDNAERMLEAAIDRNPRHSVPLAWMGNWHVLKVQQGWTQDAGQEQRRAEDRTARALDLNPDCEQALTIDGFVKTNLARDLDVAQQRYDRAISFNPSNALANLLKGTMHAFRDEGTTAVEFCERAQSQSPFDPQRYFFDCLTAASYISAGRPAEALPYARRSLMANSTHTSTLRTMAIAQWQVGDHEAARETVSKLIALEPSLTVSRWMASNPAARAPSGKTIARILASAGVPL